MDLYSGYINQLIEQFAKLPGVGNKSAQRLALHIINMPKEHVERFAKIMVDDGTLTVEVAAGKGIMSVEGFEEYMKKEL